MASRLKEHQNGVAKLLDPAAVGDDPADIVEQPGIEIAHNWPAYLPTAPPLLISMRETCGLTTLSRTTINTRRLAGAFPQAVPLGEKRIAFVRAEVEQWIRDRITARNGEVA